MKVELFHAPGCGQCEAAEASLKAAAERTVGVLDWRKVNVLEEMDRAVELGVLTLPAIAIEGELAFSSLPTAGQLRKALVRRMKRRK